jgi:predicted ATPase/DNA-binding CsgD family transcriptional regulator
VLNPVPPSSLSPRQAEIAGLVAKGKSSKEIGRILCLSPRTVDTHIAVMCERLGVRTRPELVAAVLSSQGAETRLAPDSILRPVEGGVKTFPRTLTSLVGRDADITAICALLEERQLVTLTGSGGVGKTRTSLAVAEKTIEASGRGAWFVEFAPLRGGDYIPAAIAKALGITLIGRSEPLAELIRHLKRCDGLLVLDNCEHVIEPVAAACAALLQGCAKLKILATSRQSIGILGEATYRIPSLGAPSRAERRVAQRTGVERFAAVALFVERASAAEQSFALTDENAAAVADICCRLDGIPLAIELAAARTRTLSPHELQPRLEERFRLLTDGKRDAPPRHQTLRALIDWSHDLLDERERRLFRRCAIFVGGFSLDAAVFVGRDDDLDALEVLSVLASLVDQSLVLTEREGGRMRYRLLESTRLYALERLAAANEAELGRSLHLQYFIRLFSERRARADDTAVHSEFDESFAAHIDDVRWALDSALAVGDVSAGAKLLALIGRNWTHVGLDHEGRMRIETYRTALPPREALVRAQLSTTLATLYANLFRGRSSREAAEDALIHARACGDPAVLAAALRAAAFTAPNDADADAALAEAEALSGLSPALRLELRKTRAILTFGNDDFERARPMLEALGDEHRRLGNVHEARYFAVHFAQIESRRGNVTRAIDILREQAQAIRQTSDIGRLARILLLLCSNLEAAGKCRDAVAAAREAIEQVAKREPTHPDIAVSIQYLALVSARDGDVERAAHLAGFVDAALREHDAARNPFDSVQQELLNRLGVAMTPDQLQRAYRAGAALRAENAIELALEIGN